MTTTSVIIPSLNSPIIDTVVAHLCRQTRPPDEVIIVGRDTINRLHLLSCDIPGDIRFVDTGHPISPAAARNRGAARAKGDILCFLDADCLAAPDWLEHLLARHATGAQIVGGGVSLPQTGYWTLCDNLVSFADFIETTPPGKRAHLPSLNCSIRRALFLAAGGFDERFIRPAGEDTDLSFRLRQQGYTLFFEPRARVAHRPPRHSLRDLWRHARAFGTTYRILHYRYLALLGPSLRVNLCRYNPALALLAVLPLALLDGLLCYTGQPSLIHYWTTLPGVVIAKLGWYVGLLFHRDQVYQEQNQEQP